jgi:hypothetical protein
MHGEQPFQGVQGGGHDFHRIGTFTRVGQEGDQKSQQFIFSFQQLALQKNFPGHAHDVVVHFLGFERPVYNAAYPFFGQRRTDDVGGAAVAGFFKVAQRVVVAQKNDFGAQLQVADVRRFQRSHVSVGGRRNPQDKGRVLLHFLDAGNHPGGPKNKLRFLAQRFTQTIGLFFGKIQAPAYERLLCLQHVSLARLREVAQSTANVGPNINFTNYIKLICGNIYSWGKFCLFF